MQNMEQSQQHDARQRADEELADIQVSHSSEILSDSDELSVITRTLIEAAPIGAAGSVFEQNPDAVITILNNNLKNPSKKADEALLLPILTTELDSSSDMLSLHLRARLENPEIQNGERREALTLMVYTALGSYSGDRLYSSYAFNHLAGAVASGEVSHERLESEVEELSKKAGYTDEQKDQFIQLVEERSRAYLQDTKNALRDLSKGLIFNKRMADEERRLDIFKEAEGREEVLDIAKDIVSNPAMLRFARARLVNEIYLKKETPFSERHKLQERLQTLAEAGSKLMDSDPEIFLAEHLISYNAGEWDLTAQLVAMRDVMGNRQTAAILRTAASEELFQDQALLMMIEVAHHNPDSSIIAGTLHEMLKSGEASEETVLSAAEHVLGGREVAHHFLTRIVAQSSRGAQSVLPISDLSGKESVVENLYINHYQERVSRSLERLSTYGIGLPSEKESVFIEQIAGWLYKNRKIDTNSLLEEHGLNLDEQSWELKESLKHASSSSARHLFAKVEDAIRVDVIVINEIANRLPQQQADRLLACIDLLCITWADERTVEWSSDAFDKRNFLVFASNSAKLLIKPTEDLQQRKEELFNSAKVNIGPALVAAISSLPPTVITYLINYNHDLQSSRKYYLYDETNSPHSPDRDQLNSSFWKYFRENPLAFVPVVTKGNHRYGESGLAVELVRELIQAGTAEADEALKEVYLACTWQLNNEPIFNLLRKHRPDILKQMWESGQYQKIDFHILTKLFGEPEK